MQDEINQKAVALSIRATKLTGRVLAAAMSAALRQMRKARDAPKHGKQTVKQLARQNVGLTSIPITDENIGGFERVARKYGVDFALHRDNETNPHGGEPPKWLVFFKARDADQMKVEALKRQGERTDLTSARDVPKRLTAREQVAQDAGEKSGMAVTRYIALIKLLPELLDMVDSGTFSVSTAADYIANLPQMAQGWLLECVKV